MTSSNTRFLLAFLITFALPPMIIFAVDPLGWHQSTPQTQAQLRSFPRHVQLGTLLHHANGLPERPLLIGTSQVGWGIETCQRHLSRIWLNSLEKLETLALLEDAMRPDMLVIVDYSALLSRDDTPLQPFGWWDYLFSLSILKRTVGLVVDQPSATLPFCASPQQQIPAEAKSERFATTLQRARDQLAETDAEVNLHDSIERLGPICDQTHGRLLLVLFPHFTDASIRPLLDKAYHEFDSAAKAAISGTDSACDIAFLNLAQEELDRLDAAQAQSRPEDWYDFNHFTPALGDRLLQRILTEAAQRWPEGRVRPNKGT